MSAAAADASQPAASANAFNTAEVKAFLARDAQNAPAAYKAQEAGDAKNNGGAWGGVKRES